MVARDLNWAAKTLLEYANIPASPDYIKAITVDSVENQQWLYALIKTANPGTSTMNNVFYFKAIEILQANGIQVNPYSNGSG